MNDIRSLLPKHRLDEANAEAIIALGYPAVDSVLPDLLYWLQDYNWPVAKVIAPFLAGVGTPLIPHLRAIFTTTDNEWKYWIMTLIIAKSPEVANGLHAELTRMANNPTRDESFDELNIIAHDILQQLH